MVAQFVKKIRRDSIMTATVNLEKVKELIENEEFAQFLISHSTDLGVPLYVLQTLHDAVERDAQSVDNE